MAFVHAGDSSLSNRSQGLMVKFPRVSLSHAQHYTITP
jgi:hypothetical protein